MRTININTNMRSYLDDLEVWILLYAYNYVPVLCVRAANGQKRLRAQRSLIWAFDARICVKKQNLMEWLIQFH